MLKCAQDEAVVLGICVEEPVYHDRFAGMKFMSASNGERAMELLHTLDVDFVLVNMSVPDMSVWEFVHAMRSHFPNLKWALVGSEINDQQEIAARRLGVTAVFDRTPSSDDLQEIVTHQRRRTGKRVVENRTSIEPSSLVATTVSSPAGRINRFVAPVFAASSASVGH